MKLKNILYSLTLLLSVLTLGSCVNDDDICLPEGKTQVIFSLVLQDNVLTRADGDWGDTYTGDIGLDYDNSIDLNGIQVLVFDSDATGTFQGTIDDFIYLKTAKNVYTYYGTAPSVLNATGTYKFVVLANCSEVTGLTVGTSTISDLDNIAYSLASMKYIPMWGVHTKTLDLAPGQQYNIGDIYLLRAISKVSVKLSDDLIADGFTLKSLTVDKYNSTGYVLPKNASTYAETTALDQESCINAYSSAATNLAFSGTDIMANDSVRFYIPEYANATSKDATMGVVLTLNGEDLEFPAGIAFKNYTNGVAEESSEYDIVRNHHYIFTITGAEVGHQLTLVVQTVPWDDESVTIDYTQTVSWKQGFEPDWTTPGSTGKETIDGIEYDVLYVDGGNDLSCSFTLDAPQGWLWYAELEPLTEGAGNYITFADGTTLTSGSVGQAATLYLKIATGTTSTQHRSRLKMYVRTPSGDQSLEVNKLKCIISRSI